MNNKINFVHFTYQSAIIIIKYVFFWTNKLQVIRKCNTLLWKWVCFSNLYRYFIFLYFNLSFNLFLFCLSLLIKYYPPRTGSPGLILREYGRGGENVSRIYTYSYLTETPSQGYLRRPIQPYDKPPTSPHFHRPSCTLYLILFYKYIYS